MRSMTVIERMVKIGKLVLIGNRVYGISEELFRLPDCDIRRLISLSGDDYDKASELVMRTGIDANLYDRLVEEFHVHDDIMRWATMLTDAAG